MPLQQLWIDPNTGATYPQSFVVWDNEGVDPLARVAGVQYRRYSSQTAYSLGYQPLQALGTQVTGAAYASWFAQSIQAAQTSFRSAMRGATASFYLGAPEFSGSVVV